MPFTYKYMHVLEIQIMLGGLISCVGCISCNTVVGHMFNFMTYSKCSTYAPLHFRCFFTLYRIPFFWFSSLKPDGLRARSSYSQGFVENNGFAL